jgi:hypothetical protein
VILGTSTYSKRGALLECDYVNKNEIGGRITYATKFLNSMTTPIPFDAFSSELLPGETIQWTGRPNPTVIFHKEDWGLTPFSLLWGGFAFFWLLGAPGLGNF